MKPVPTSEYISSVAESSSLESTVGLFSFHCVVLISSPPNSTPSDVLPFTTWTLPEKKTFLIITMFKYFKIIFWYISNLTPTMVIPVLHMYTVKPELNDSWEKELLSPTIFFLEQISFILLTTCDHQISVKRDLRPSKFGRRAFYNLFSRLL